MKGQSEPPKTPPPPSGPRTPPPPAGPKKLASAEEVAEYLDVPVNTLYQWRYLRKGPKGSRVGKYLRYRWTDVEKWLDRQAAAA